MKYSICVQRAGSRDVSTGYVTAASALDSVRALKDQGAGSIQIFDFKTGRLIDEATLLRADALDKQTLTRPVVMARPR